MTPRDRDPAVWAAAYGAAYDREFASVYRSFDAPIPKERMHAALAFMARPETTEVLRTIADAAVLALHPPTPKIRWDTTCGRFPACTGECAKGLRCEPKRQATQQTPADRLAALEAAERAYLIAAGWALVGPEHQNGSVEMWREGRRQLARNLALGEQQDIDRDARKST